MQQQRCVSSTAGGGSSGGGVGTTSTNCFYAATAPPMQQTSMLPFSSTAANGSSFPQQLPAISPTFIEHKYSANTFKEKFFANLRQNQQNVTNKLKSLNPTLMVDSSKTSTIADNGSINDDTSNVITKTSLETEEGIDENSCGKDNDGNCGSSALFTMECVNNDNPEKCSIQQQLNETIKNNLYKKSIN